MTPPRIGITTGLTDGVYTASEKYLTAVRSAGGDPQLLVPLSNRADYPKLLDNLEGVLFTGGADVDPRLYNGEPHPAVYGVDPRRDEMEMILTREVAVRGIPFLGICRGIQVINVAFGGTLYTHVPDQFSGALNQSWHGVAGGELAHPVWLAKESILSSIMGGTSFQANSMHHQGVNRPGVSLQIAAIAHDGLIEALDLPGHPFGLAVQWHPEWLQAMEPHRRIFSALVEAARSAR